MSRRFLALCALVGGMTLAGCASTNEEAVQRAKDQEILEMRAQLDQMGADTAKAVAEAEAAKTRSSQAERDAQLRAKQAEEAAARAREWQAQAEAVKRDLAAKPVAPAVVDNGSLNEKADQIRKSHPGTIVNVTKDGNIEITLPSDVTFGSGKSALSEAGKKSVRSLASLLNGEFAPYMIRVEGHTDATPLKKTVDKFTDNFGLGSARALEVVRFMKSEMKIDPARLMSASRGEQQPVAKGDKPADLAKNRRVEIVVVIPRESATAEAK